MDTLLHSIETVCRNHPHILIFFSLAIGYYVGKIKIFGFNLGSTASVLLAAIVLGQIEVEITPLIKSVAFALFIFTIGYKVGPHFFGGLKKDAIQYTILAFFVALVGLVTTILLGKFFGFDKGTTAGLIAGGMTQSSIIGTAEDAIKNLSISGAQKTILTSNIAVSYAITYIFGVAGLILFYKIVPKLLKIDLKGEAQKLEAKLSGATTTQTATDDFHKNSITNKNIEKKMHATDLMMVGLGCFLGTLLGLAAIKIGTMPLTLGIGGGILLVGLFFGWLQSIYPTLGHIPNEAQWILTDLGLNLFIACVGLTAGPKAIDALQAHGPTLFFAGIAVTLLPHIFGLLFGRIVLKLNYILLLGALVGAGTATPSLSVLKDETNSSTPVLGYTVPYAIGNFILTVLGTVIVNLM